MKEEYSQKIASNLLQTGAIKFNFEKPFTWTSGIKSPVYCDNRLSLSFVEVRNLIKEAYIQVIHEHFPDTEVIAGIATGAIAQGAMVADQMGLPFVYVRSKAKGFGMDKTVEGTLQKGAKTVIIEDLISTGGSSLKAMKDLQNEGANVLGMVAILSYELPMAGKNFSENNCTLYTLSNFSTVLDVALTKGYITKEEAGKLHKWHQDPEIFFSSSCFL